MKKTDLGYDETNKKLSSRIDIHNQLSEKDIDPWILNLAEIKPGEKILDIGCGNGKQVVSFGKALENTGHITAVDISRELLETAKKKAVANGIHNVTFSSHNMDVSFPFPDGEFDLISSCFSIYYVSDSDKLIKEFLRLLKTDGRILIVGPTPKNTEDFWKLHGEVTGGRIPEKPLMRRARIEKEFIPLTKKYFSDVSIKIFDNNLHFKTTQQVLDYYTASLLFKESYDTEAEKKEILGKMKREIDKKIEIDGEFIIKKQVYGMVGYRK